VGAAGVGLATDAPEGLAAAAGSQQHPPAGISGQQHPAFLI
jgi:hypothetical protein